MPNKIIKKTPGSKNIQPQEVDILHVVQLEPGGSATARIGIFEATIPTPSLHIISHPDIGDRLGVSITKLDEDGDYILMCHVQNFSPQVCDITIRSAE